jgi:ABC-type sugar transport system ATPase subunit
VTEKVVVEVDGVEKAFGHVRALRGVTLHAFEGEVTAIIGDNGAGKSTLIKCIAGVYRPDVGRVRITGKELGVLAPHGTRAAGVEVVYQDLALVDSMTVWQNVFLGRELTNSGFGLKWLDRRTMIHRSSQVVQELAVDVPNVRQTVRRLSGGQRQAVAIARAVTWGSLLTILDEPTAALGVRERSAVEALILKLRADQRTFLLVSHSFDQVLRLADAVWVLRHGAVVGYRRCAETSGEELVSLVTGAAASGLSA